ncbi:unnamed protein product [Parnassius apollo]|uniref:(apollo) hypothetical protein n=1 Tax=Parnassius apollo TaxID=110799 RepID=A0A8S3YCB7_PARAO|nr:unnamed protein product [Parnassius apollo]
MVQRGTRIGPLPGGRRGASGAGAGRGSMRAASRARGAVRSPSSPPHPSSPPEGLVSAGSSRTQQAAPAAGGARRMRWSQTMNANALRAYFRAKGEETGCLAYRARMHRFFAELEPSLSVNEQNLADRVRYILRSNIFGDAELERLRREAVPSSDGNATAGNAAPLIAQQTANVDAAVNIPFVVDSDDDGIVSYELEKMRSILEESMLETRSMPLENRPRLPRITLSKRNRAVVRALNPMLVTYLEASRDLCETDSILFGAALAVCRIIGAKLPMAGRATQQGSAIPAWRKRVEDRIAKARALIGRLTSFRSGNIRPRVVRTVRMAFAGTNISLSQPDITQKLTERIDDLKQKIAAWGKRNRRFSERSRRFNQNRLFQSDQKRLYKSLERPEVCGAGPGPDQADTVAFWRGLWSEPVNHSEGPWMEVVASQSASVTPMDPVTITPEDVAEAVSIRLTKQQTSTNAIDDGTSKLPVRNNYVTSQTAPDQTGRPWEPMHPMRPAVACCRPSDPSGVGKIKGAAPRGATVPVATCTGASASVVIVHFTCGGACAYTHMMKMNQRFAATYATVRSVSPNMLECQSTGRTRPAHAVGTLSRGHDRHIQAVERLARPVAWRAVGPHL